MNTDTTTDTFYDGRIRVKQPISGYRYGIDSILLANMVSASPGDTVLDMGTGCGIIPLIMAYRNPGIRFFGLEIQPYMAELAVENVAENNMKDHIDIRCQDLVSLQPEDLPEAVDLVVCNPPYQKKSSGRISPNPQRAAAKHEVWMTLETLLDAVRRMVKPSGRLAMVYPAARGAELLSQMQAFGIAPKSLIPIQSYPHTDAIIMIVEGVCGAQAGMTTQPPVCIWQTPGEYSSCVRQMFQT